MIHKLWEIYSPELGEQAFASDGRQSLFTTSPLPQKKLDFAVVLDAVTSKRYIKALSISFDHRTGNISSSIISFSDVLFFFCYLGWLASTLGARRMATLVAMET